MSLNYTPKVSVIVPVYNTELYVERAIISLMEQTLDDVQFIIIDDGSKDNSFEIIKTVIARYPYRMNQVTLISRGNKGVAATRSEGMVIAKGQYVIHLDSDDWVEPNWLESMYTKAVLDNADVVVCDFVMVYKEHQEYYHNNVANLGRECVKRLLSGEISNSNCDKLVSRELLNKYEINFHGGFDMGEDFLVTLLVFINAQSVTHVDKVLFYYNRTNENSLTKSYTLKALSDLADIVQLADRYLNKAKLDNYCQYEMNIFKLNVRGLFIVHSQGDMNLIKYALNLYPNTNSMIFSSKVKILKVLYLMRLLGIESLSKWILWIWLWLKKLVDG
ncbi:glycosyltransferase family 2 protein [Aeromonas caviae]